MIVIERTASGDYVVFKLSRGKREELGTFPSLEDAEAWVWLTGVGR